MQPPGGSVPASRSKRTRLLAFLLLALVPLGAWQIYVYLTEFANDAPVDPETEFFRSDKEKLNRLRGAVISERPESPPMSEWSQWRGPARDGIFALRVPLKAWPEAGPRKLWTAPGGPGHSSVSIAAGKVYTVVQDGGDEVVVCLDGATGESKWRLRYPAKFFEQWAGVGPHGTPTVADGRVYVVGATGMFHCLEAETGKIVWKRDLVQTLGVKMPPHGVSVSPLLDGDRVLIMHGTVAAFDRKDGAPAWKSGADRPGHSSPITAVIGGRRQIVALTGETLLGLAPEDGTRLWGFPWATAGDINVATPIVAGNYVFIASGYNKGCALVEVSQGPDGGFGARPVYEHNRMRSKFATPVLHRDHLYGFDDTFFVCMEFRTGKVKWKQRGFGQGSVILAGDRLVVLGEEGRLALVEPSAESYRELGSCTVSKTRCWAPPSLAHGKMFLRDQESILCFDLESPP